LGSPAPPRTAIYTLSLHDALPIYTVVVAKIACRGDAERPRRALEKRPSGIVVARRRNLKDGTRKDALGQVVDPLEAAPSVRRRRSEEHTSELQSRENLVCRLLLEK